MNREFFGLNLKTYQAKHLLQQPQGLLRHLDKTSAVGNLLEFGIDVYLLQKVVLGNLVK